MACERCGGLHVRPRKPEMDQSGYTLRYRHHGLGFLEEPSIAVQLEHMRLDQYCVSWHHQRTRSMHRSLAFYYHRQHVVQDQPHGLQGNRLARRGVVVEEHSIHCVHCGGSFHSWQQSLDGSERCGRSILHRWLQDFAGQRLLFHLVCTQSSDHRHVAPGIGGGRNRLRGSLHASLGLEDA